VQCGRQKNARQCIILHCALPDRMGIRENERLDLDQSSLGAARQLF
jgi:hypothetical protein